MRAPKLSIFETAAELELWPKILPHYRYIRYLERSPNRNVVVMAARRSGIPIKWTSEQIIDRERVEVHFHHLKAFSKGMRVVWTFEEKPDGVLVTIVHDLHEFAKILLLRGIEIALQFHKSEQAAAGIKRLDERFDTIPR